MDSASFDAKLKALTARAEEGLRRLTPPADARPARLHAAMRHSLDAGGKRLRPVLCLASAEAFSPGADADAAAVALECVHTYSLIHDDLPCMDDSDLRRGRPSCHKAFDEATALLAGDALLALAFELIATGHAERPGLAASLVRELGRTAGSTLLVGGQAEDMGGLAAGATDDRLDFILEGKTAAMIGSSFAMGAMIGGAVAVDVDRFRRAGRAVGRAFQLVDDLLDVTADSASLGKPTGADAENGKLTFVSLHGAEATRARIAGLTASAEAELSASKADTGFLIELVRRMSARRN